MSRERWHRRGELLLDVIDRSRTDKRNLAGQHFIEHHAQTINVALWFYIERTYLLWRHILRRTDDSACLRLIADLRVAEILGDTKIRKISVLIFIKQDIGRL